jgi:hypothetical protein
MSLRTPVCLSLAVALLGGCSGKTRSESGEKTTSTPLPPKDSTGYQTDGYSHLIHADTDYYTTGPQQGRPPDGQLPAGTKVNVVREAGSYTLVRTEAGVEAYVASDALKKTAE